MMKATGKALSSVERSRERGDAGAPLDLTEGLLQSRVHVDRIPARRDEQVDLLGGQLQPGLDIVELGALGLREIVEGHVLDHEVNVPAVPAGERAPVFPDRLLRKAAAPFDQLAAPDLDRQAQRIEFVANGGTD